MKAFVLDNESSRECVDPGVCSLLAGAGGKLVKTNYAGSKLLPPGSCDKE